MTYRITRKQLAAQIDIINGMLGMSGDEIGSIELAGGHGVHRLSNSAGGVSDLMGGYHPARETHRFLSGMIAALRITHEPRSVIR